MRTKEYVYLVWRMSHAYEEDVLHGVYATEKLAEAERERLKGIHPHPWIEQRELHG